MSRLGRGTCQSWQLLHSGALLLAVHISSAQEQDSGAVTTSHSRKRAEIHVGFVIMGVLALLTVLVALKRAVVPRMSMTRMARNFALTKDQSVAAATPSKDVDIEACTVTLHIDQADNQYALSSLQAKYIQDIITSLPTGCDFVESDEAKDSREALQAKEPFAELLKLPVVSIVSEEAMVDPGKTKSPKPAKKKLRPKKLSKQGSNGTMEHALSKKKRVIAKVDGKRVGSQRAQDAGTSLPVQRSMSTLSSAQGNSTFLKVPAPSPEDHLDTDSHIGHSASEDISTHAPSICSGSSSRGVRCPMPCAVRGMR